MVSTSWIRLAGMALMMCALTLGASAHPPADGAFRNHGVPAPVSECRGAIAAADAQGRPIVLAVALDYPPGRSRASLLLISASDGKTQQFWYPNPNADAPANYCLLLSSANRLYLMFGDAFLEFDPDARRWTFDRNLQSGTAMSMAEAPDGVIYAATYPTAHLIAFDPKARTARVVGRLDPEEKYPSYLAADGSDWVYAGVGTARCDLVAFNVKTGERRAFAAAEDRKVGVGRVYIGRDGAAYGRLPTREGWLRFRNGTAEPVAQPASEAPTRAIAWQRTLNDFPDGSRLTLFDLPEKRLIVTSPDGAANVVPFDYVSAGALITSMSLGPGERVYGSVCHPFRLFVCDPATGAPANLGGMKAIGGGNFCGIAARGGLLYGAAYSGGLLCAYDPARPWNDSDNADANPAILARVPADLGRPRALILHPDGRRLIMAGFPGYGRVGGSLLFYDLDQRAADLVPNDRLVPGQSIITVDALPNGALVCGTSVLAPGGGHGTAKAGALCLLDHAGQSVTFQTQPLPDSDEDIVSVRALSDTLVCGLTSRSQYFVFDAARKEIVHRADLKAHGLPLRPNQSLVRAPDGRLFLVLSKRILEIDPKRHTPLPRAQIPQDASAGIALAAGRLYYASGPEVWSWKLP